MENLKENNHSEHPDLDAALNILSEYIENKSIPEAVQFRSPRQRELFNNELKELHEKCCAFFHSDNDNESSELN